MPFNFDANLLSLSLTFDGLTVSRAKAGENEKFKNCYNEIKKTFAYFDDYVLENDGPNAHLKFYRLLTLPQIIIVLATFVNRGLLSVAEKDAFLKKWAERNEEAEKFLAGRLCGDKHKDLVTIGKFIKDCKDNDILVLLQRYLLNKDFDYLRAKGFVKISFWHGTVDKAGTVAATSHSWAMIEKSFSLQIANNIHEECHFDDETAARKGRRLGVHQFFGMKRYYGPLSTPAKTNKLIAAFNRGDVQTFDEGYVRHFNRFV